MCATEYTIEMARSKRTPNSMGQQQCMPGYKEQSICFNNGNRLAVFSMFFCTCFVLISPLNSTPNNRKTNYRGRSGEGLHGLLVVLRYLSISHFQIHSSLFFKASISAKSFILKLGFISMQIETNWHQKTFALRLALKKRPT